MTSKAPYRKPTVESHGRIDLPGDITASELFDVLKEASLRAGLSPAARELGLLATCVSVMRERGWTVLPPGHHTPIDPR